MVEKFESGTPPQERGGIENKELAEQGIATLGLKIYFHTNYHHIVISKDISHFPLDR